MADVDRVVPMPEPVRITHVALRFKDRIWSLPRPYRHHHVLRVIFFARTVLDSQDRDDDMTHCDAHGKDQGFIDSLGRYLTRPEALVIARNAGQLKLGDRIIGGTLTSEDIW